MEECNPDLCFLLLGCGWRHGSDRPIIQFTRIPPASEGGPDRLDMIEGKVIGGRPGQRIVLFAKAQNVWWVQPLDVEPFTKIEQDSSWRSATHLGSEYAALLVDPYISSSINNPRASETRRTGAGGRKCKRRKVLPTLPSRH
jgi:hypothetical protein